MKIARLECFQVRWQPGEKPSQSSAYVRVWTDDGRYGLGEASPMQGGMASLGILMRDIAPSVVGADPLVVEFTEPARSRSLRSKSN